MNSCIIYIYDTLLNIILSNNILICTPSIYYILYTYYNMFKIGYRYIYIYEYVISSGASTHIQYIITISYIFTWTFVQIYFTLRLYIPANVLDDVGLYNIIWWCSVLLTFIKKYKTNLRYFFYLIIY